MAARNMQRIEINIHEKLCVKLVIYKDHTRMHGQKNITFWKALNVYCSDIRNKSVQYFRENKTYFYIKNECNVGANFFLYSEAKMTQFLCYA